MLSIEFLLNEYMIVSQ